MERLKYVQKPIVVKTGGGDFRSVFFGRLRPLYFVVDSVMHGLKEACHNLHSSTNRFHHRSLSEITTLVNSWDKSWRTHRLERCYKGKNREFKLDIWKIAFGDRVLKSLLPLPLVI